MTGPWYHSPARDRAIAVLESQARRATRAVIKARARSYALRPRDLESIMPGLACLSPKRAVEYLNALHKPPHWRHFGFGGEHPALNLRGAMLYARYARAKARQLARRAA